MAPPPAPPVQPLAPPRAVLPAILVFALLSTCVSLAFMQRPGRASSQSGSAGVPYSAMRPPLFADANADGVRDIITWEYVAHDSFRKRLVAVDAMTGKVLWYSATFEPQAEMEARSTVAGGRILIDFARVLNGIDVKTGAVAFRARMDSRPMRYCQARYGPLLAFLEDGTTVSIDPASGRVAETTPRFDCEPGWSDGFWGREVTQMPGQWLFHRDGFRNKVPALAGVPVSPEMALGMGIVRAPGAGVVLGHRQRGPRVPFALGVEGGKVLWKTELPADHPEEADDGIPEVATLTATRLLVAYHRRENGVGRFKLACLDAATGKRVWETRIPGAEGHFSGIAVTEHHAFVAHRFKLSVFSMADGKFLHQLARPL